MNNVFDSPSVALAGVLFDGMTVIRAEWQPRESDPGDPWQRHSRAYRQLQQRQRQGFWPLDTAADPTDQEDDFLTGR